MRLVRKKLHPIVYSWATSVLCEGAMPSVHYLFDFSPITEDMRSASLTSEREKDLRNVDRFVFNVPQSVECVFCEADRQQALSKQQGQANPVPCRTSFPPVVNTLPQQRDPTLLQRLAA